MKLASLEAVTQALNDAGVRYLIAGGLAVAAHGHGRATFDIDVVLQLQPENIRKAGAALEVLGYHPSVPVKMTQFADPEIRASWIVDKGMVVLQLISSRHPETSIDLFVTEPFDFDREYLAALVGELKPGLQARFVSLKTLLRMKAAAGRDKDLEDLRQLGALNRRADDD